MGGGVHVEINFGGEPFVALLAEEGGSQAQMGIADDETSAADAAGDDGGEELTSMDFGLAQGGADAEDGAFAIGADANGNEHGTVAQEASVADFFIAGVEDEIGTGQQGTLAPELEFVIELGGAGADLGGAVLPSKVVDFEAWKVIFRWCTLSDRRQALIASALMPVVTSFGIGGVLPRMVALRRAEGASWV